MSALKGLKVLFAFLIIPLKFFDNIRTHIGILFLDSSGNIHGILRGESIFTSVTQELLNKLSEITAGDRDVLDGGTNDVSISHGDDMGDAITTVDDRASQGPVTDLPRGPACSEGQDGLDGNVESWDVEGLKEDLRGLFPVLWGIEWGFSEEEGVILGLGT